MTARLPHLTVVSCRHPSWGAPPLDGGHCPLGCVSSISCHSFCIPGQPHCLVRASIAGISRDPFQALSSLRPRCAQMVSSSVPTTPHVRLTHSEGRAPALLCAPGPRALTPLRPLFSMSQKHPELNTGKSELLMPPPARPHTVPSWPQWPSPISPSRSQVSETPGPPFLLTWHPSPSPVDFTS